MGSVSGPVRNLYPARSWDDDPRRWLLAGVSALLVLVGVAVVISVAIPLFRGATPSWEITSPPWSWVVGLIGLLIAIWMIAWVIRIFAWGLWGPAYGWGNRHRFYHHYYRDWAMGYDPAVVTARERYARGEITREQFDQIVRDLNSPSRPMTP